MTIPEIANQLRTQDNRITELPIFNVEQKKRYVVPEGYSDTYVWVDRSSEEVDEEKALEWLDKNDKFWIPGGPTEEYRKCYYRDEYVTVQPFFTEMGAKKYIAINGHNLREPRIYVESGYRNEEWETIRNFLMNKPTGWKS